MTLTNRRDFLRQTSLSAVCLSALRGQDAKFVVADTTFGKIRAIDNAGIKTFKGIPYAATTAGQNRFMPPADPAKWTGVRDALEFGHSAPQRDPSVAPAGGGLGVAAQNLPAEGEDCLVLNVWTPALNDNRKRPVMFWCHGGGFATGSGSSPDTDGTNLARRGDVVVVTINHRLNVLGFANLSEFSRDFASSGDNGMLDIVHALRWVRANIGHFGGDPNTVMIFGQSGGGRKVETLLAMPSAKGLFHRATIESGAALQVAGRDVAMRNAEQLLAKLGIAKSDVRHLQKLPVEKIMAAYFAVVRDQPGIDQTVSGFVPSVDGKILPQHPFQPAASSVSAEVPIMIGNTRTEMTLFSANDADAFRLNDDGLQTRVRGLLGANAPEMIALYRKLNPSATPSDIYFLIASDYRYGAPTVKIAERRAALGKGPVFLYYFKWETPVQGGRLKSPHTMEIPFAFDNVKISARLTGGGPEAMALADKLSDTWIAFARTGDPNNAKIPHWPAFTSTERATMVMDNTCEVVKDPLREQRIAMFRAMNLT
ncbi:MAG: carboxylesterase/lipase family protein [Bryobacterales bacterium]|nr:carboxylesterase/lipase family protein [Bryobacterales bacterium]MBV9402003.1 carboxylesterase/lipase family protein [Bryobacterales bacterium]